VELDEQARTVRRNCHIYRVLALGTIAILMSCTSGAGIKATQQSNASSADATTDVSANSVSQNVDAQNPHIPRVDAPVVLPAIKPKSGEVLIAYKETNFGFVMTFGFDTYIYHFLIDKDSRLDAVVREERKLGDETNRTIGSFRFLGDKFIIDFEQSDGRILSSTLILGEGSATLTGALNWTYRIDPAGNFSISSLDGGYRERYDVVPGSPFRKITITDHGTVEATGSFEDEGPKGIVYLQRKTGDIAGAEDLTIELWIDGKEDYRFRTSHVEPVNEVFASGLAALLRGPHAFTNFILIDIAMMESGKNIRPVLAYALKHPASSNQ
jgi:hypothetical protein